MPRRFLQSRYVGRPQFLAAALLGVYLVQCLWLARIDSRDSQRTLPASRRIFQGLQQWQGGPIAGTPDSRRYEHLPQPQFPRAEQRLAIADSFDPDRSPLYYLIAGAPFVPWPRQFTEARPLWPWLALTPYLFFGVMLGGSLWYVARRLYGNAGGYIALGLYCFSPAMILNVADFSAGAEMGGVWGAFGAVWTAVAVAHTLYAPREVVLWNWRRIFLLGLSFALALGTQFSLVILLPVAMLLMLWVAPVRKGAVLVIWTSALAIALVLLFASYFFHPTLFWQSLKHASWFPFEPRALGMFFPYHEALPRIFAASPPLIVALPVSLIVCFSWKRARYFGNTTPLGIAALMFVLALASPLFPGQGFYLITMVFLFVFVAGVFADLLETRRGLLVLAALGGVLVASALWNLVQLARLERG